MRFFWGGFRGLGVHKGLGFAGCWDLGCRVSGFWGFRV